MIITLKLDTITCVLTFRSLLIRQRNIWNSVVTYTIIFAQILVISINKVKMALFKEILKCVTPDQFSNSVYAKIAKCIALMDTASPAHLPAHYAL